MARQLEYAKEDVRGLPTGPKRIDGFLNVALAVILLTGWSVEGWFGDDHDVCVFQLRLSDQGTPKVQTVDHRRHQVDRDPCVRLRPNRAIAAGLLRRQANANSMRRTGMLPADAGRRGKAVARSPGPAQRGPKWRPCRLRPLGALSSRVESMRRWCETRAAVGVGT